MCMFSLEVRNVADTRMFGRLMQPGEQLLVYQMALQAGDNLAMVLPLPVPPDAGEDAIRFVNLERAPYFFNGLDELAPVWEDERRYDIDPEMLSGNDAAHAALAVHAVGRYEASFVPKIADFMRLDARFRLADHVLDQLTTYRDWGFAVFKLRELSDARSEPVHPMAMSFRTRYPASLFFPTVHVHDSQLHPTAWFDHLIFFQAHIRRKHGSFWYQDGEPLAEGLVPQWSEQEQYERGRYRVTDEFGRILPENPRYGRLRWGRTSLVHDIYDLRKARELLDEEMPLHGFGMHGTMKNRDTWFHLDTL